MPKIAYERWKPNTTTISLLAQAVAIATDYGKHIPFEVRRIALNMDQIDEYQPPPNPAKLSDSRARDYVYDYGTESWELDALKPSVLVDLIDGEIAGIVDMDRLEQRREAQEANRDRINVMD